MNPKLPFNSSKNIIVNLVNTPNKRGREYKPKKPHPRDDSYTSLLDEFIEHYAKKSTQNRWLKTCFFILVSVLVLATLGSCIVAIFLMIQKDGNPVTDVVGIIGALATILTSILVLPKIIGDYLFPKKEDEGVLDFAKELKESDVRKDEINLTKLVKETRIEEEVETIKSETLKDE